MRTGFIGALSVICLLVALLAGCGNNAQSRVTRPLARVAVTEAISRDVPVYLDCIGKAVAIEVVSIQPQVSGRITEIHFTDGADVKKGDLLFTIDPRPYRAQLHLAEATLAEKRAMLELAKIQFKRYSELLATNSVSQFDYDQRKNTQETADAQVRESEAQVETARLNLEYLLHSLAHRWQGRATARGHRKRGGRKYRLVIGDSEIGPDLR